MSRIALALAVGVAAPIVLTGSADAAPSVTVCAIQGSGAESPLTGQDVLTAGVVTAVASNGVWIQQPGCDGDPATSDGLFAFRGSGAVGDRVDVTGQVAEFFGLTEVVAEATEVTGQVAPPAPTVIEPGAARRPGYYETLEGMLVRLEGGQTYVGTNTFGETFLVPGSIEQRVRRTDEAPEVSDAVGPLSFTFDNYKLLNTEPATITRTPGSRGRPAPIATAPPGAQLTVVANHFKSKFGGTPANDFFEDCRVEQAQVLRDNVRGLPLVTLLGEFNAFRDSPTLTALTQGGYTNTVDRIPADRRFSFVFQGRVQFLDHIVVSPAVAESVEAVDSSKLDGDTPSRGSRTTWTRGSPPAPTIRW